ncbi:MAG: murein biosynthesis integral membrane protein MurJ [Flexilinea sp.]
MKISSLTKTSLLLFVCFGIDKIAAIARQLIIARQFGLSSELDVFNIANNLPDMLFILISGGAMSMVLIPVMTNVLTQEGKQAAWRLFSSVANLAFLCSLILAAVIALFAEPIVASEIGIAPGFSTGQKAMVVNLMRLNLAATMIFSVSGLVMGGLQANRHFLLPALAPILYNFGQIFGAIILAPSNPYTIGGFRFPCFGMGIYGLVAGVILGAILHLSIQIPGLIRLKFHWSPIIAFREEPVQKLLRIMVPRVLSVFFVQLIFIIRDNLASRLATGAVTALSYGYMFQQLPETLIGTVLGTAILPSLSLFIAEKDKKSFEDTIQKSCRLSVAFSLGSAVIMGIGLGPLVQFAFGMEATETSLIMWTLRGFLVGLAGHCLLEVASRSFYSQQEALLPLVGTVINLILYIVIGSFLYRRLDAPGISLTDSIAFTVQAFFLLFLLKLPPEVRLKWTRGKNRFWRWIAGDEALRSVQLSAKIGLGKTTLRAGVGALVSGAICYAVTVCHNGNPDILVKSFIGMALAVIIYIPFILPEIKLLRQF